MHYKTKGSLRRHQNQECGRLHRWSCLYCSHSVKQRYNLMIHVAHRHKDRFAEFRKWTTINEALISDYMEFDHIFVPPTFDEFLQAPKPSKKSKEGKNSLRKPPESGPPPCRPGYSPDSQFACRHCGKRYKWKSTMRRHEQDECGDQEPKFQCPYCPYKAKQKGNLRVHVRKHHSPNADDGLTAFKKEVKSD
ncbi:unnamed protein product [Phyllotreta striolata]|uniref:C2H2-type domain-containing protein n=1 Tax=Phyllotreta striolata TaxID=444603 RepID=A0A9N9U116_PHYSR|nr:unnamed protein product [Phyllotreta striolata]